MSQQHLIYNFDQMQVYIPTIIADGDFAPYETYRDDAEIWLINDIIGQDLYDDLLEAHTGSAVLVGKWKSALNHARKLVALKAYHIAIPFLDLIQTQNGFAVASNQQQAPASKERVKSLRDGVLTRLNDAIESLLKYFDENTESFTSWVAAPSYTERHDLMIVSARDFNQLININTSHRLYLAMTALIRNVEDMYINPTVSKDLVDLIKAKVMSTSDMTTPIQAIYRDLKHAVANLTMAKAIDSMSVIVEPDGIKLAYTMGESSVSDVNRNKALVDRYQSTGDFYLRKVLEYILTHLSDFPAYTGSDIYEDQSAGYQGYENTETDPIFVAGV